MCPARMRCGSSPTSSRSCLFILFANVLGLIPTAFTPTTHIAVTAVMALGVVPDRDDPRLRAARRHLPETVLGLERATALAPDPRGDRADFLHGAPVSHSVRLAGAITAGHAVMKVFAAFVGLGPHRAAGDRWHGRDLRARTARGLHPGLRLHHPYLRLPQGRASPPPLKRRRAAARHRQTSIARRHDHGRRYRKHGSVHRRRHRGPRHGPRALGVGKSPGTFSPAPCGTPPPPRAQTATLFIGIAFAEALGIFSFLVALLLMFAV